MGVLSYSRPMTTDSELDLLSTSIQRMLPRYLADLERLVNIDCGSYNKDGVDEVGRWVAAQFEDLGADVTVERNDELSDTVVAVADLGRRCRQNL